MKKNDPTHTLLILGLNTGDLFLTQKNYHGMPPVIGFFEYIEGVKSINRLHSRSAYFKPVKEGTIGIYFRKNVMSENTRYWAMFHEVWIGGKQCVIHENFISPLPKGKNNDE